MKLKDALAIVYDLAKENALDTGDSELFQEAYRQQNALVIVLEHIQTIPDSLYADVLASGGYISNHESDLYIEVNEANRERLKRYDITTATVFQNQVTGKACFDVPFAYLPFWEAKQKSAAKVTN